jgi:probable F420-dependent oxidoreductase
VLKLGVITPVLTRLPRASARWEADAGIDEVTVIAEAADRLGYHHLTCSEHVAIPTSVAATRGSRYWDPLSTFGYLAAKTGRIRLATHVLVLGYHHPLEIAKRYGTLDRVCKGRLILGVGVGSLQEEFELLGADFEDRGPRADDAVRALRTSLSETTPSYEGDYFRYRDLIVDPCALQPRVPIWIGGRTGRSLRRAVELGDGWAPFGLRSDEVAQLLRRARDSEQWAGRDGPLEVILWPEPPLDPGDRPDEARRRVEEIVEAGATMVNLRFIHHSLDHYLDQLEAMVDVVGG